MADEEDELKPFWLKADCPDNLDPDWVPQPSGIVMDVNATAIIMCDECPCPPCPICPSCDDAWHSVHESGNYFELWGIPCGGDCQADTPQLLGVYNTMWAYEKYGWEGCWWSEHLESDPPNCVTWLGVSPGCALITIGREQVCMDDPCRDRMLEIVKECSYHNYWHQRSTGWLYNPDNMSNMKPVIFVWVSWYYNEETGKYKGWLRALDCDCYETLIATAENLSERPISPEVFGYKFVSVSNACDEDNCQAKISALLALAAQNGWTVYGEGVIAHKAYITINNVTTYGNWYALCEQNWRQESGYWEYGESLTAVQRYLCCAETPDGFWVLTCDCSGPSFIAKNDPVEDYRIYLELPGACECDGNEGLDPLRELILTYPDVFGIDDVVWGNDNKYDYSYGTIEGCDVCGYDYQYWSGIPDMRVMYIDYRALCFTGSAFDKDGSVKTMLRVIYPPGSTGAPSTGGSFGSRRYFTWPSGDRGCVNYGIFDTVSFTGTHFEPFVHDNEIYRATGGIHDPLYEGRDFVGFGRVWVNRDTDDKINLCNPSTYCSENEEDAREEAGCGRPAPSICIELANTWKFWDKQELLIPVFTTVEHPCERSTRTGPDGETIYCYTDKWWEMGQNLDTCAWAYLNIHYVQTNRGLIVKGVSGFQSSYTLLGLKHYPQYTRCYDMYPEEIPGWEDDTVTCPIDEDMHFCSEDFDVETEEEIPEE